MVGQDGSLPPSNITGFKDGLLAALLNRVSIVTDDYDACNRLLDEEMRGRLARFCYQVGCISSVLGFFMFSSLKCPYLQVRCLELSRKMVLL